MILRLMLTLLGLMLIAIGLLEGGWALLAGWLGCNFLALGIAHALGAHRVLGKRADGRLPLWSRVVFLPFLLYSHTVWWVIRILSREPAYNAVTDQLVVGRRLLASELKEAFDNYVDLTAEVSEPAAIRHSDAYRSFPILDGAAPDLEALDEAVEGLRPGRTFIHCAKGHGRTGLFALAVLLKSKRARTVEEGLGLLRAARPRMRLSRAQRRCVGAFAQRFVP